MRKLIIYLLLLIGFVVMIMPFAWMLITSLKLPGEVQQWPPKWYTKNFFTTREVKVKTKLGALRTLKGISLSEALSFTSSSSEDENILSISVEDDPFYRGTMTLDINGFDYISKAQVADFREWLNNLNKPLNFNDETPEKFFEEVFTYYKSGNTPYFKRLDYISELERKIDSAISGVKLIQRFVERRISNKAEQERFGKFLQDIIKKLDGLKNEVLKYKSGKYLVLEDDEIKEIFEKLNNVDLKYDGENELVSVYKTKVLNVIENEKQVIKFYLDVYSYFKKIQIYNVESPIIAKVMSKKERIELLKNNLSELKNFELLDEFIKNNDFEHLPEKFSKKIDDYFINNYNIKPAYLNDLKSLIVTYKNLLIENKVEYDKILESGGFEDLVVISDEVLKDSNTYKIFKSKLNVVKDDIKDYHNLIKELIVYTDYVDKVRKIYNNSMNSWKIVEAPDFVKAVRVRNGEVIEIELSDVSPIYLSDDNLDKVSLKFSFGEVFKNIFQNYVDAWKAAPFSRYYLNTIFVATSTTVLEVILASMAAYAFSWMNFPGKNFLFGLFLATMMVPGEVLLVPNFITISKFGWIDTYYSLIVPWIVSVFAIFLMRQHFMAIPKELFDASKIDGCSHWRFLWQIVVPLSKPVIITGALLKFVGSWNSFLWVLIVTNSDKYRTLPVGLQNFSSDVGTLYNQLMAAATFSVLPVIILFLLTQQYFVRGIARTGLK